MYELTPELIKVDRCERVRRARRVRRLAELLRRDKRR
jgi:hypothetical protein